MDPRTDYIAAKYARLRGFGPLQCPRAKFLDLAPYGPSLGSSTCSRIEYIYLYVELIQGVPYHWAHFVFVIFLGSRAHTEELFIAIG